jgi:type IV secretion system protein VirB1
MKRDVAAVAGLLMLTGCGMPRIDIRPTGTAVSARSPAERAYQEGKADLAAGRAGLAIVAFETALANDPRSVSVLNALGAAYDELNRYDVAQTFYQQALKLEPDSPDVINNMAVSLRMAGKPEAAQWFIRAARLDPKNSVIRANVTLAEADPAVSRMAVPAAPRMADIAAPRAVEAATPPVANTVAPRVADTAVARVALPVAPPVATIATPPEANSVAPRVAETAVARVALPVAPPVANIATPPVANTVAPRVAEAVVARVAVPVAVPAAPPVATIAMPPVANTVAPRVAETAVARVAVPAAPPVAVPLVPRLVAVNAPRDEAGDVEVNRPRVERASALEYQVEIPKDPPTDLGKAVKPRSTRNVAAVLPRIAVPPLDAAQSPAAAPAAVTTFDPALLACAPNVAPGTLNAIIQVESGGNPLALHVNGSDEQPPPARDPAEAARMAESYVERGYTVDVGLMQVNTRNLAASGHTVAQALDPCTNILRGSTILSTDYAKAADYAKATDYAKAADHATAARKPGEDTPPLLAALSAYNTGDFHRGFINGYVAQVIAGNANVDPHRPPPMPGRGGRLITVSGSGKTGHVHGHSHAPRTGTERLEPETELSAVARLIAAGAL